MKEMLEQVFARELARLDAKSKEQPLDLDDLKALSLLTQYLKSYQEPAKQEINLLKDLTSEQLLALVNMAEDGNERPETKPGVKPKGPKRNNKTKGKR